MASSLALSRGGAWHQRAMAGPVALRCQAASLGPGQASDGWCQARSVTGQRTLVPAGVRHRESSVVGRVRPCRHDTITTSWIRA
jgi:hypothetical protein